MSRAAALLLALLALPAAAAAQESVFNAGAFGLPASGESMAARGTGGAEAGPMTETFSLENPARMGRFGRAGLYMTLLGQKTEIEGAQGTGEFDDVVFPSAQVVFPGWGESVVGLGYTQVLDFDARIVSSVLFEGDSVDVTLDSEGGLAVVSPGVALAVGDRTLVGATFDVYVGSRELIHIVELAETSPGALETADTLGRQFRGFGVNLGVERAIGSAARIAASWRIRPALQGEITRASGEGVEGREEDFDLPSEVVVDATVRLGSTVHAGLAGRWSPWGSSEIPGVDEERLDDMLEIGGGLEWRPATRTALLVGPAAPLRIGARWRRLPLVTDGEPVTEWSASLGYGRTFTGWSRLDAVLEYGRRGALAENGLTERFVRLGIALAAFERWERVD